MLLKPHYLFKFKSTNTKKEIDRVVDIIMNKKIYLPTASKLNDPFEGLSVQVHFGYAGSGYRAALGQTDMFYNRELLNYKVVSFSSVVNSPIMWANYGNQYQGCCIIFSTKNILSKVKPVLYTDSLFNTDDIENASDLIPDIIEEALTVKKRDWSYENEWRYIEKTNKKYIQLSYDDIVGVIIGQDMKKIYKDLLSKACEQENIFCIKTRIMHSDSELKFVPYNSDDSETLKYEIEKIEDINLRCLIDVLNGNDTPKGYYSPE